LALPPSITATHEFVVPRSIPITLLIIQPLCYGRPAAARYFGTATAPSGPGLGVYGTVLGVSTNYV
jgi:hypothetical protein